MHCPDYPKEGNNDACWKIAPGVWVMDDHKWALWVWAINKDILPRTLFHVDYHWDGADDFTDDDDTLITLLSTPEQLKKVLSEDRLIRKDSFIAPAIRAEFFEEIHFLCYQRNIEQGLDPDVLIKQPVRQYIHPDISPAIRLLKPDRTALDLDADIFNRSTFFGRGDLWPDESIRQFLTGLKNVIKSSPLITIALSYCYSGSEQDTHHLSELILPIILSFRK
jgi:hypothetical protein